MTQCKKKIVIVGGGFSGLFSAKKILKKLGDRVDIELISDINYFVFQPLLPEVVAGTINAQDAVTPLRLLLKGIKVRLATVQSVDPENKTLFYVQGQKRKLQSLIYDELIIASGQETRLELFPGLAQHGHCMKNLADAYRLRNHVIDCLEMADVTSYPDIKKSALTFVIAGGGFSGVETAGELNEMLNRVLPQYPNIDPEEIRMVIVQRGNRLLPELPEKLSIYTLEILQKRGIEVKLNTGIVSASRYALLTDDGNTIRTHTIVTTIGNGPSKFVEELPIELVRGKISVDPFLRVNGLSHVWSLGDVAQVPIPINAELDPKPSFAPPTSQSAVQQANLIAENISCHLDQSPLIPFQYHNKGALASLGGYVGVANIFGINVTGFTAWFLWRFIYIGMLPGFSTRLRVALNWLFDYFLPRTIVNMAETKSGGTQVLSYDAGELIIDVNDLLEGYYLVLSGSFKKTYMEKSGDAIQEMVLHKGDGLGNSGIKTNQLSDCRVVALERGQILLLNSDEFDYFKKSLDSLTV